MVIFLKKTQTNKKQTTTTKTHQKKKNPTPETNERAGLFKQIEEK